MLFYCKIDKPKDFILVTYQATCLYSQESFFSENLSYHISFERSLKTKNVVGNNILKLYFETIFLLCDMLNILTYF